MEQACWPRLEACEAPQRLLGKLLPYNSVAERIARELRFGRWLEVFGPPRLGKTAGVVWGLVC